MFGCMFVRPIYGDVYVILGWCPTVRRTDTHNCSLSQTQRSLRAHALTGIPATSAWLMFCESRKIRALRLLHWAPLQDMSFTARRSIGLLDIRKKHYTRCLVLDTAEKQKSFIVEIPKTVSYLASTSVVTCSGARFLGLMVYCGVCFYVLVSYVESTWFHVWTIMIKDRSQAPASQRHCCAIIYNQRVLHKNMVSRKRTCRRLPTRLQQQHLRRTYVSPLLLKTRRCTAMSMTARWLNVFRLAESLIQHGR